jgi:hypothetical protein
VAYRGLSAGTDILCVVFAVLSIPALWLIELIDELRNKEP